MLTIHHQNSMLTECFLSYIASKRWNYLPFHICHLPTIEYALKTFVQWTLLLSPHNASHLLTFNLFFCSVSLLTGLPAHLPLRTAFTLLIVNPHCLLPDSSLHLLYLSFIISIVINTSIFHKVFMSQVLGACSIKYDRYKFCIYCY